MSIKKSSSRDLEAKISRLERDLKKSELSRKRLEQISVDHDRILREKSQLWKTIHNLHSMTAMPALYLDENLNITGFSGDFSTLAKNVFRLAKGKGNLSEFLAEGDIQPIRHYLQKVGALGKLSYAGGLAWELKYKGPGHSDKIGKNWTVSAGCSERNWEIRTDCGKLKIMHQPHIQSNVDCYLIFSEVLGGPGEDLKVVCRFKTSKNEENIRDLSLVLYGFAGHCEMPCDFAGYTICSGSFYNSEARLQRKAADILSRPERLEPDTEYEVTVERTGGRISRLLRNLRTGEEAEPLVAFDSNVPDDLQGHLGFTTFSGEAQFYDIEVFTRKSLFSLEQFRIPFDCEARLRDEKSNERRFKLRIWKNDSYPDAGLILLFEDITESRKAEETLRSSETRHRALFENANDAIFIEDENERIIDVNPKACQMFGRSREELLKMKTSDLRPENRQSNPMRREGHFETEALYPDGSPLPIEVTLATLREGDKVLYLSIVRDITARKRAEEALRRSEERYRAVAESASTGIGIADDNEQLTYVNPAFADMLGRTQEELTGMNLSELMPPDEFAKIKGMTSLRRKGLKNSYETILRRKNGCSFSVLISAAPLYTADGKFEGSLAVITDISERKQAEEKLRESEKTVRTILNTSVEPMMLVDSAGKIIDLNETAAFRYRAKVGELLGKCCYDLVPADVAEKRKEYDDIVLQFGMPVRFEEKFEGRLFDTTVCPVFDAAEKVVRLSIFARDITSQKTTEEALREREEKYRTLFESLQDAAFLADADTGMILEANQQAEALLGFTRDEIIGMHHTELHPKEELGKYQNIFEKQISLGSSAEFDCEVLRKDGNLVPVLITGKTLEVSGRNYILWIFRDITLHKLMLEKQIRTSKLESIGTLAGGIAHDFNNILTSILGNLSLASLITDRKSKVHELLKEAEKASHRASDLVKQLLTFSRERVPEIKPASISEALQEWVEFSLQGSKVGCEFEVAADLWHVQIDAGQIAHAIENIVINADQAMPEGGTIKVMAENFIVGPGDSLPLPDGNYVRITIRDHGTGIPEAFLPKIFDPYFTTRKGASGLGLAMAFTIVKKHNGLISVDSEEGRGTSVQIYLPALAGWKSITPPKSETTLESHGKVLVLEDENSVTDITSKMLDYMGYEVKVATEGRQALIAYREALEAGAPFDLVILDLTIPGGMGAIETVKLLLEMDPQARAIVSSGYSTDEALHEYAQYGFKGAVTKPYDFERLRAVLQRILRDNTS